MTTKLHEMITTFRTYCCTFAPELKINQRPSRMAKVKQQEQTFDYAMDYLERLLDMEEVMNRKIDQAVRKYMKVNIKK